MLGSLASQPWELGRMAIDSAGQGGTGSARENARWQHGSGCSWNIAGNSEHRWCLSYGFPAVNRHPDQGKSYKEQYLIGAG